MCVLKREKEEEAPLCCVALYNKLKPQSSWLVQVPSQMRSGQLINCLHQIYLLVTLSFHKNLAWSFLTTSRVVENSALPLTELLNFSLPVWSEMSILVTWATLNLVFGQWKTLFCTLPGSSGFSAVPSITFFLTSIVLETCPWKIWSHCNRWDQPISVSPFYLLSP